MMAIRQMTVPPPTDQTALSEWIERQQLWVWRYLRFLGAPNDVAEDVCQETLLAALHHDMPSRPDPVAMSWLRTTACNFYRRQLRGVRQLAEVQQVLARDAMVTMRDLVREARSDDVHDHLRACLETLSEPVRDVLDLRYRDGASRGEMAKQTGRKPEAIKTMLRRAKDHLRTCIERRRMK